MNGFNDRPAFLGNDDTFGNGEDEEIYEFMNEDGQWIEVFKESMSDDEFEQLKIGGRGFRRKPPTKPTGSGSSGGGIKRKLSAANRIFLENFVAPFVVGYTLDAITGKKVLDHPAGSTENSDGTVTHPNGSIAQLDNSIKHPDGKVTQPDGQTINCPESEGGGTFNLKTGVREYANGDSAQGTLVGGKWKFSE